MMTINGQVLKAMLESGCNNLNNKKSEVDALNVFPVPDGDTGTNMSLTFTNGISEVRKSGSDSLPVIAKTLSRGLLMGARGNSGVILSQIFRGFYQSVKEKDEISVTDFAEALSNGSRLAYKAVMRPVEGTILTVIREACEAGTAFAEENPEADCQQFMNCVCEAADASLQRTPELLPVLKEAHVVDSGGSGLLAVLEGFKAYLDGNPVQEGAPQEVKKEEKNEKASGYRTEYILNLSQQGKLSFKEERFRRQLEQLANKITLIAREDEVRLRVNTMTPGEILLLGQRYGSFAKVQIENIQDELNPSIIEEEPAAEEKEYGIIATAAGEGLKKLFTDYRVDVVVSGGQTMNPSTEDFVKAIAKVNARHIFILPNNSNIIMAAKQAAEVTEDKDVIVLETKSVPQGLGACINFNPDDEVDANKAAMLDAIDNVRSGSVTYSIKDTTVDGVEIHEGDYMSIFEKDIVFTSRDKIEAVTHLIDVMCDEDTEIITLIKGEDGTDEECEAIQAYIDEHYDVDVDLEDGGQPVYSFLIGAE
ncbi:MAG: DAK2 domain-containing protein [Erysipelotrichaceae bacterium]|nr:DAK2 domain-containing protein [Erysipelotrichaceae bacterium]